MTPGPPPTRSSAALTRSGAGFVRCTMLESVQPSASSRASSRSMKCATSSDFADDASTTLQPRDLRSSISPRAPSNGCTSCDHLREQRVLGGADLVAVLGVEALAGEVGHELVAAHPDRAVTAPDGDRDAVQAKRAIPGQRVLVVGVDERAVDVEDRGRCAHAVSLLSLAEAAHQPEHEPQADEQRRRSATTVTTTVVRPNSTSVTSSTAPFIATARQTSPASASLDRDRDELRLVALAEHEAVVGGRRDEQRRGGGRGQQRHEVDVALELRDLREALLERARRAGTRTAPARRASRRAARRAAGRARG